MLTDLGVKLVPIKLPSRLPVGALTVILDAEAAAVFDEITRQNITEDLNTWPDTFRQGQFIPAIEYLAGQPHSHARDARDGGDDVASRSVRRRPRPDVDQSNRPPFRDPAERASHSWWRRSADRPDVHRPAVRRDRTCWPSPMPTSGRRTSTSPGRRWTRYLPKSLGLGLRFESQSRPTFRPVPRGRL